MRFFAFISLLCIVALSTGCPNGLKTKPSIGFKKPDSLTTNINSYLFNAQVRYDCAMRGQLFTPDKLGEPLGPGTCPAGVNSDAEVKKGKERAKTIRNEAIEDGFAVIDANYLTFINDLEVGRSRGSFLADVVELGTGAAIGITKGERAIHILGIALTAFRGGRKSADLNFYKQQTTPILVAKMDDNRAKVFIGISKQKEYNSDQYELKQAIRDLVRYYNAGTLVVAFSELSKDAATSARVSEDKVLELKGIKLDSIPSPEKANLSDQIFDQFKSLIGEYHSIQKLEASALVADQTKGAADRKVLRDKLERIWRAIDPVDSFKTSLTALKADSAYTAIFAKIPATYSTVTVEEFLQIIAAFSAKNADETDLKVTQKFADILKATNK